MVSGQVQVIVHGGFWVLCGLYLIIPVSVKHTLISVALDFVIKHLEAACPQDLLGKFRLILLVLLHRASNIFAMMPAAF